MARWRSSVGLPLGFIIVQERSPVDRSSIMHFTITLNNQYPFIEKGETIGAFGKYAP